MSSQTKRRDTRAVVDTLAEEATRAYFASHPIEGEYYLYFLPGTETNDGTLQWGREAPAGYQLADPRSERGFTPRPALTARAADIARRLPILRWGV